MRQVLFRLTIQMFQLHRWWCIRRRIPSNCHPIHGPNGLIGWEDERGKIYLTKYPTGGIMKSFNNR